MKYTFFPTKDATLYSHSQSVNTGNDPILELIKDNVDIDAATSQSSRVVMGFNWAEASASLIKLPSFSAKFDIADYTATLKLYTATAKNIPYSYKLVTYPLKESWQMGIGKLDHNPKTTKGVSWDYRDTSGSTAWTTPGGLYDAPNATIQSQSFEFETSDISINVHQTITMWEAGVSSSADGLILAFTSSQEADGLEYGTLAFYSRDTNTIYSPRIEIAWDDHVLDTGSLSTIDSDEIMVYLKNNKYEYKETELARFQVRSRDVYPTQTYSTSSAALQDNMLPTGSYYSVKDGETEETVIDFDASTKLSCTGSGNYFDFHMGALTAERLYKMIIKVEDRNYTGQVELFDSNHIFKVVR